ncbi:MAG: hypothetical protein ACP5J1_07355 [Fervidicoccaceae archaeon]
MRVKFGYRVKGSFEIPFGNYRVELSPYDLESIVLKGYVLHPRITPRGILGNAWVESVENCENAVFLNEDSYICSALAGLSHEERGVALIKGIKEYIVELGNGARYKGERAVFSSAAGASVIALYDPPHTHVFTATQEGSTVHERVYRGEPERASIGYRSFSVVYRDGRSQIFHADEISEAGFPIDALAHCNGTVLGKSSGWLIWMDSEMPKPTTIVESEKISFVGFQSGLPIFKIENKLLRLEGGALINVEIADASGFVTASNVIVIDRDDELFVYDANLKPYMKMRKDASSKCFAHESEVFCCTEGICGFLERGESELHASADISSGSHTLHIAATDFPFYVVSENEERRGGDIEMREERATILEPFEFLVELRHLLGSHKLYLLSPEAEVSIDAEAKILTSSGRHECGGTAYGKINVKRVEAPERIKLFALGKDLKEGDSIELCLEKATETINVEAFDAISNVRKEIASIKPSITYIGSPSSDIKVVHEYDESVIEIESDAEVRNPILHCRNGDFPLQGKISEVKGCVAPAFITYELYREGFIFLRRRDVVLKGLIDFLPLSIRESGLNEYSEGGFVVKVAVPELPNIDPLSSFKLKVGRGAELYFKSKQIGRIAILLGDRSFLKTAIVRAGMNVLYIPFSSSYFLTFDNGHRTYSYKLEVPIEELMRIAVKQAEALAMKTEQSINFINLQQL